MCLHPISIIRHSEGLVDERITIPCGKCPECLRKKQKDWMFRLWMENRVSKSSFFVTLTYNNENLPSDGVCKEDAQKFFKRLRKHLKCRYFLVSEYGDTFHRAHMHFLLFLPTSIRLSDIIHLVDKCWQKGNIQVGDVTIQSISYCSKYCLKDRQPEEHLNKTFTLMSRRPGIGDMNLANRFADNDFQYFIKGIKYMPPRYYRDKYFTNDQLINYRNKILDYGECRKHTESLFDRQARGREWIFRYNELQRQSRARKLR